jgi:glycosyltransferase involved in cell wall biosynthesis
METDDRIGVQHVISGLGIGCAEKLLVWAARYYDRSRFRLGVVSLISGGELTSEVRHEDVVLVELDQTRGRITRAGFTGLVEAARGFAPQILQGHMFHSNILSRVVGSITKVKVIINTIHTGWEPLHRRFVDAATGFLPDGYITYSQQTGRVVTTPGRYGKSVRHIPYGIEIPARWSGDREELRKRLGLPTGGPVWIAVGRLNEAKAFPDLLDAFSRLNAYGPGPFLVIAGEGDERVRLERIIQETGLAGKVFLLGSRNDVKDLYAASDAFVLSSRREGNPLVLLEAMAAGLPVVATDVGVVSTMTEPGTTALLVPPGRPSELAAAMHSVMDMGDEAQALGEAGRKRVELYYDFRWMQGETERFYLELLGREEK